MHVTFVLHVVRVFLDDNAFHVSGFGVPSDMVSDGELLDHSRSFQDTARSGARPAADRLTDRRGLRQRSREDPGDILPTITRPMLSPPSSPRRRPYSQVNRRSPAADEWICVSRSCWNR